MILDFSFLSHLSLILDTSLDELSQLVELSSLSESEELLSELLLSLIVINGMGTSNLMDDVVKFFVDLSDV